MKILKMNLSALIVFFILSTSLDASSGPMGLYGRVIKRREEAAAIGVNPLSDEADEEDNYINYGSNTAYTKKVKITYYWVAIEKEAPRSDQEQVDIKSCKDNKIIKTVSKQYFEEVKMEGSGKLATGQMINCADDKCNCFELIQGEPQGSKNNPLHIYTSLAANKIAFGTKVYIEKLDGIVLPNNQTHNGCFVVEDRSWSFGKSHIDWFVYDIANFETLDDKIKLSKVKAQFNANCQIQDYSTSNSKPNSSSTKKADSKALLSNYLGRLLSMVLVTNSIL